MPESRKLPRTIQALDELFAFLDRELGPHGLDTRTSFCLNLAAEEVFTNMVRHNQVGTSDSIEVEVDVAPEAVTLRLVDSDVDPWDPGSAPPVDPTAPVEKRVPGGLGIHLVKSTVDRLTYEYDRRRMKVTVIKNRER